MGLVEVYIDTEDLYRFKELNYSWHVASNGKAIAKFYVRTTLYMGIVDNKPKYKMLYMQDFVMNRREGEVVDHKNHNTFDNRKNNLRKTDQTQNTRNRLKANINNNSSGHRNVSWSVRAEKWLVQFQINGKNKCIAKFDYEDLDKAIKLAKHKRVELYGEYCNGKDIDL